MRGETRKAASRAPLMDDICKHLRESSGYVRTWMTRQPAVKEESLTDWLLYDISQRLPNIIYYTAFTRHEEARATGADWEWWVLFHNGAARFRVQAKKVSGSSDLYPELARANRHGLQIDMLLTSATEANAIPLYAFYSAVRADWMCAVAPRGQHDDGVFIAGARNIHSLLFGGARRAVAADEVLRLSNPFSCFACCSLVRNSRGGMRDYLRRYYPAEARVTDGSDNSSPGFHQQLPSYLKSFLEIPREGLPDWWEREYASQMQGFRALLVYDFRHNDA